MASTYSTNLKIELMGTGENSGTWGTITNTNLGTAFEQAVIGLGNPDYTSDANLTITLTNTNASQAARCLVLNVTSAFGSLTATRELIVPTIQKQYIVQNNTTGGQSITVKTSGGTGITVPNGRKAHLYVDGTNVIQMFDFVDINGGTIDGATVGAASASTGAFTSLTASGATTLNGAVALGDAAGDLITVPGTVNSNLLFTDATYDIGASGATRPRDMFLSRNLTVGGTLTLAGGVNLNGNVTVGDSSADTLTINSTITSNLIFTDNTYDIGASGATRPRNLFLAGNATIGGAQTLTGALTVDSTTDSSSTTTGSIQTDGGVGIAQALYVGTTANIAGVATFSAGSAAAPAITTTGDTNTGIWFPAADTIAFTEGGVESLRIDSSGNVGINTTNMLSKLNIANSYISVGSNSNTTQTNILLQGVGFSNSATIFGNTSIRSTYNAGTNGASLEFYTAASGTSTTEVGRFSTSGNFGVGTSNPATKINVSATAPVVRIDATAAYNANPTATLSFVGTYNVAGGLDEFATILGAKSNATDGDGKGYLAFSTNTSTGSMSEKMRITSAGDVGIGTSSPAYKLDVVGAIRATSTLNPAIIVKGINFPIQVFYNDGRTEFTSVNYDGLSTNGAQDLYLVSGQKTVFGVNSNGTVIYPMEITATGNVGIGTSSPATKLNVSGATGQTIMISNTSTSLTTGGSMGNLDFAAGTANTTNARISGLVVGTSEAGGDLVVETRADGGSLTEKMRITGAGDVGIGTSSPSSYGKFAVVGSTSQGSSFVSTGTNAFSLISAVSTGATMYLGVAGTAAGTLIDIGGISDNATYFGSRTNTVTQLVSNNTVRVTINTSGEVGIGTTSPTQPLTVQADSSAEAIAIIGRSSGNNSRIDFQNNANTTRLFAIGVGDTAVDLYADANIPMVFATNNAERARITSGGNLLVGTTANASNIKVRVKGGNGDEFEMDNDGSQFTTFYLSNNGTIKVSSYWDNTNARYQIVAVSGGVYLASGGTSWTAVSDERKKDIIEPITNATSKVNQLRAVIGKYKTDAEGTRRSFLIAQDVQAVLPEAVDATNADELGLSYSEIIPLLVAAIKEQNTTIESLKARLDAANL